MEELLKLNAQSYQALNHPIEQISYIQRQFADIYTFENIDVLLGKDERVTESYIRKKLLHQKRGGLCYELNGALYLVLKDLGFDVYLGAATVWSEDGWIIDKTHTILFFYLNDETYVIDSGSGTNLTLRPLKINGDSFTTPAGTFRVRTKKTERGTVIGERFVNGEWTLRYAFSMKHVGWDDLTRIKNLIFQHEESPFNEKLLIARLTDNGTISINNDRFLRRDQDGNETKIPFENNTEMLEVIKRHASLATYEAAKTYVSNVSKK